MIKHEYSFLNINGHSSSLSALMLTILLLVEEAVRDPFVSYKTFRGSVIRPCSAVAAAVAGEAR